MEKLLQLILERLEQIQQYLFSRRSSTGGAGNVNVQLPDRIRVQEPLRVISDTGSYVSGEVEISNIPLPVSQSGSWSVGITNTPLPVSQSGSWSVGIANTPLPVSQSGSWSVTVTNTPLTVQYGAVQFAVINATAGGDTTILPAVSGKRIRVIAYAVVASASVSIKFRSGTTDITGTMRIVEGGGIAHAFDSGLFQTAVGEPLVINLSSNATVGGYVVYREV